MSNKLLLGGGAVAAVVLAVAAYYVQGDAAPTDVRLKLMPNHPVHWSEHDVSLWLNATVKYPEYSRVFAANAVDGPTLFYLTESHLEYMKVANPIHRTKILAHLDLLRGRCMCTPPSQTDFWEYARLNTYRVLYLGALFEWAPRVGFAYVSLFDAELLWDVLGQFGAEAYPYAVLLGAALLFLAVPHAALVLFAIRVVLPNNYMLAFAFILSHVFKAITDKDELMSMLPELREPRDFQMWINFMFNVRASRLSWLKETLYPLVFVLLGPFFPYYLSLFCFYAYIIVYIFLNAVFIIDLIIEKVQGNKQPAEGQ